MIRVTYQITVWSVYRSTTNTYFDNHKLGVRPIHRSTTNTHFDSHKLRVWPDRLYLSNSERRSKAFKRDLTNAAQMDFYSTSCINVFIAKKQLFPLSIQWIHNCIIYLLSLDRSVKLWFYCFKRAPVSLCGPLYPASFLMIVNGCSNETNTLCINGSQPFCWREPNPDLQFCWTATLKFFNAIQLTRFVLQQNEVCYTKYWTFYWKTAEGRAKGARETNAALRIGVGNHCSVSYPCLVAQSTKLMNTKGTAFEMIDSRLNVF